MRMVEAARFLWIATQPLDSATGTRKRVSSFFHDIKLVATAKRTSRGCPQARAKSRKLASSSSLQEPLPADFRKREHANSRTSMPPALSSGHSLPSGHNALPSGHNAVDAGPLLIDLKPVKEKEVEECFHTLVDPRSSW